MKLITDHLGQIIAVIAAISLLITSIVFFKGPVSLFFENIIEKETSIGDKVFANLDNVGMFDGEGGAGGSGSGGAGGGSGETGDGETEQPEQYVAGLYETGAIDLYYEEGADAIEGMMIKSWDELIAENIVRVDNGTLYTNCDKVAGANGSSDLLVGDLILPEDGSIVILGDAAFGYCNNLSGITLPDSINQINAMAFYRCLNLSKILFANTTGWYAARSSTATSGITIPSADLMDASTAAATMENYSGLHWLRSDK